MLAGKRIRCKKCGDEFEVPSDPHRRGSHREDSDGNDRDLAADDIEKNFFSSNEDSDDRKTVKGELIPTGLPPIDAQQAETQSDDFPELNIPKAKTRRQTWRPGDQGDDASDRERDESRQFDFLFEHHPRPVGNRFSIPVSISILLLPLLIYFTARFAAESVPPQYLADVKRLAVQRANHDGAKSSLSPEELAAGGADSVATDRRFSDPNRLVIRDVCLGGNGRYLITYRASQRHSSGDGFVLVEDTQTRATVGKILIDGPRVSLAASVDTLVVGAWGSASLQAYDLPSLRLKQQYLSPPEEAPISLAMGHCSDGPLYVINSQSRLEIRDVATLEELPGREEIADARLLFDKRSLCNASPDGSVFCAQGSHLNIVQFSLGRLRGEGQSTVFASDHVAPTLSFDGSKIFTPQGVFTSALAMSDVKHRSCLAAADGPFYVGPSARTKSELNRLWLYVNDHDDPIAEIPKKIASPLAVARNPFATQVLTNDKRLILIPSRNRIATIDSEGHETAIHDFDFDQAVRKAGLRVPRIVSLPRTTVMRGETFEYQIDSKGIQNPLYRLTVAPRRMRVDQNGLLQWECDRQEGFIHPVVVETFDEESRTSQSFHIRVGGPLANSTMVRDDGSNRPATRPSFTAAEFPRQNDISISVDGADARDITRVDLPGIARQPALAGDGRFLIVRLVEIDSLAVIDLLHPLDVRYLPISPSALFAASRSSIITCDLKLATLHRYDLQTLKLVRSGPFPISNAPEEVEEVETEAGIGEASQISGSEPEVSGDDTIARSFHQVARSLHRDGEFDNSPVHQVRMSMGFASDGPLLFCDRDHGFLIDPNSFQRDGAAARDAESTRLLSSRWGFRMLPQGKSFVGTYDYESPSELRGGEVDGNNIVYYTPTSYPAPYTQSFPGVTFVQDSFHTPVAKQVIMGIGPTRGKHLAVPSAGRDSYVAVEMHERELSTRSTTTVYQYHDSEFHSPAERKKLVSLARDDLEPPLVEKRDYRGFLPWENRLIHVPSLQLLVTLPAVGNRVVIVPLPSPKKQFATNHHRSWSTAGASLLAGTRHGADQ